MTDVDVEIDESERNFNKKNYQEQKDNITDEENTSYSTQMKNPMEKVNNNQNKNNSILRKECSFQNKEDFEKLIESSKIIKEDQYTFTISENYGKFKEMNVNKKKKKEKNTIKLNIDKAKFIFLSDNSLSFCKDNEYFFNKFCNFNNILLEFNFKDPTDMLTMLSVNKTIKSFEKDMQDTKPKSLSLKFKGNFSELIKEYDTLYIPNNMSINELSFHDSLSALSFSDVKNLLSKLDREITSLKFKNFKINTNEQVKDLMEIIALTKCQQISLNRIEVEILSNTKSELLHFFTIFLSKEEELLIGQTYVEKDSQKYVISPFPNLEALILKNAPLAYFSDLKEIICRSEPKINKKIYVDENSFISYPYQIYKLKFELPKISLWFDFDIIGEAEYEKNPSESSLEFIRLLNPSVLERVTFRNYLKVKKFLKRSEQEDQKAKRMRVMEDEMEIETCDESTEVKLYFKNCSSIFIINILEDSLIQYKDLSFVDCIQGKETEKIDLSHSDSKSENKELEEEEEEEKIKEDMQIWSNYTPKLNLKIKESNLNIQYNKINISSFIVGFSSNFNEKLKAIDVCVENGTIEKILGNFYSQSNEIDDKNKDSNYNENPKINGSFYGSCFTKYCTVQWNFKGMKAIKIAETTFDEKLSKKIEFLKDVKEIIFESIDFDPLFKEALNLKMSNFVFDFFTFSCFIFNKDCHDIDIWFNKAKYLWNENDFKKEISNFIKPYKMLEPFKERGEKKFTVTYKNLTERNMIILMFLLLYEVNVVLSSNKKDGLFRYFESCFIYFKKDDENEEINNVGVMERDILCISSKYIPNKLVEDFQKNYKGVVLKQIKKGNNENIEEEL